MNYGPKIVTSGLVLALDAAERTSFDSTNLIWKDLSGNSQNFYSYAYGNPSSYPSFSNNSISTSFSLTTTNFLECLNPNTTLKNLLYVDHTIEIACKINSLTRGIDLNGSSGLNGIQTEISTSMIIWKGFHGGLYMDTTNIIYSIFNGMVNQQYAFTAINTFVGQNIMIHAIRISNTLYIYINGILKVTTNISSTANYGHTILRLGAADFGIFGGGGTYLWPSNITFYSTKLYNIGFNQSQVTQNFNSMRRRFNI